MGRPAWAGLEAASMALYTGGATGISPCAASLAPDPHLSHLALGPLPSPDGFLMAPQVSYLSACSVPREVAAGQRRSVLLKQRTLIQSCASTAQRRAAGAPWVLTLNQPPHPWPGEAEKREPRAQCCGVCSDQVHWASCAQDCDAHVLGQGLTLLKDCDA